MIGKKFSGTTKVWKDTLINIDKIREAIKKDTGQNPPRTEIIDAWSRSEQVRARTLNYYKKRCGLL